MTAYVLDSFAVIAYLRHEPGGPRVQQLLQDASDERVALFLCLINHGEVTYISHRLGGPAAEREAIRIIDSLPITVVGVDRPLVFAAARIKAQSHLSYADAFAASLALAREAVLVTGDPKFLAL